jgi:phosphoribosylformylglycinamidine cyclo-ligase
MLRTFNCGVGMVVIVASTDANAVAASLRRSGEAPWAIGSLAPRAGHEALRYLGSLAGTPR